MRIGLIRHGLTNWNLERRAQGQTDIPLNQEGEQQAKALANHLIDEDWELIVSSPLSRAFKTASTVADKLNIPLIKDVRLQEKSFGVVEGTTVKERIEIWGEDWKTMDLGAEPDVSVQDRSQQCIDHFCEKYPNKNILFVSHGATLNQLVKRLLNNPDFDRGFGNTSLSVFENELGKWTCVKLDCTKHLENAEAEI